MYMTQTEWVNHFGGKGAVAEARPYQSLQYTHCQLSLQPWKDPVTTADGVIYDVASIMKWLKKHKVDPVSGEPMKAGQLIALHFHQNAEGKNHCPVTYKTFTDYTHIVAIRTTGNVYAWDAIEKLNIKARNWKELITGEPFTRKDIIHLQDPTDPNKGNVQLFYHIKQGLSEKQKEEEKKKVDPRADISLSSTAKVIFAEIDARNAEKARVKKREIAAAKMAGTYVKPSDRPKQFHTPSANFTSSSFTAAIDNTFKFKPKVTTQKGFVRLTTSMGNINLKIHADLVPLASENFLTHCATGYYDGVGFHRNIRNFMIQGGDPLGTGMGGESIWKRKFPDEFTKLKHSGVGVLSMANSGPDSNGSQFFIMYKSAPHLDGKHSVFGEVVGGTEVLKAMAKAEVDVQDRPVEPIKIIKAEVFGNPFSSESLAAQKKEEAEVKKKEKEKSEYGSWLSNPQAAMSKSTAVKKNSSTTIGKYVSTDRKAPPPTAQKRGLDFGKVTQGRPKKARSTYGNFGNF
eukprot:TRINITY_DN3576_c0_g1_i1.p1 TRINITY_DN3576_c0_g1~~TRINITY_DN3576_c0_g1_i1.p1  ORF type:complete len:515 (+),score=153.29 TRINITY_DN3576_c0_g1_i1:76-1620(+)